MARLLCCFTVPGEPVPKHRPRFQNPSPRALARWAYAYVSWARTKRGPAPKIPRGRTHTHEKTVAYEQAVAAAALRAWRRLPLREELLTVEIVSVLPRPKRTPKKRGPGLLLHRGRADVDNLSKAILDGAQGVIFHNDNQITDLVVAKRAAEIDGAPRTIVRVYESTHDGAAMYGVPPKAQELPSP